MNVTSAAAAAANDDGCRRCPPWKIPRSRRYPAATVALMLLMMLMFCCPMRVTEVVAMVADDAVVRTSSDEDAGSLSTSVADGRTPGDFDHGLPGSLPRRDDSSTRRSRGAAAGWRTLIAIGRRTAARSGFDCAGRRPAEPARAEVVNNAKPKPLATTPPTTTVGVTPAAVTARLNSTLVITPLPRRHRSGLSRIPIHSSSSRSPPSSLSSVFRDAVGTLFRQLYNSHLLARAKSYSAAHKTAVTEQLNDNGRYFLRRNRSQNDSDIKYTARTADAATAAGDITPFLDVSEKDASLKLLIGGGRFLARTKRQSDEVKSVDDDRETSLSDNLPNTTASNNGASTESFIIHTRTSEATESIGVPLAVAALR